MTGLVDKIKDKVSNKDTKSNSNDEQSFTIQPHPAKSNDPADLGPPVTGGGLSSNPAAQAHHARDPHVPSEGVLNSLEQPASREELQARHAELNK